MDSGALADVAARLDGLTDLFRRRLLDDRVRTAAFEEIQTRARRLEDALAAESLRPVVRRIVLVIDRLRSSEDETGLAGSVADELVDLLESMGVRPIPVGREVDPRRHDVVSVEGAGPLLLVNGLIHDGWEKDGVVLRPATVTAVRSAPEAADGVGEAR